MNTKVQYLYLCFGLKGPMFIPMIQDLLIVIPSILPPNPILSLPRFKFFFFFRFNVIYPYIELSNFSQPFLSLQSINCIRKKLLPCIPKFAPFVVYG